MSKIESFLEELLKENNKWSLGRISFILLLLYSSYFWVILRADTPSTLTATFTLVATYVVTGKGIEAVKERFAVEQIASESK